MKKYVKTIALLLIPALAMVLLIACNQDKACDSLCRLTVSTDCSRSLSSTVESSIPSVGNLLWYYSATKKDEGMYSTGEGWHAFESGMSTVGVFSSGKWVFSFYGFRSEGKATEAIGKQNPGTYAVYTCEEIELYLSGPEYVVDITLSVGGDIENGKVVFSDLSFDPTSYVSSLTQGGELKLRICEGSDVIAETTVLSYDTGIQSYDFTFDSGVGSYTLSPFPTGSHTYTLCVLFSYPGIEEKTICSRDITVSAAPGLVAVVGGGL